MNAFVRRLVTRVATRLAGLAVLSAAALPAALVPVSVHAQEFPTRPITLIVPYTPGGATDLTFRALADAARKHFGQNVVVENRPGGSGAVAVSSMLARAPDGYTVTVIVPVLQRASYQSKFSFDVVKDVTPIIQVSGLQYGIVVRADSPYRTLRDLVEAGKANPGKIAYMSAGIGSGGHIYMEEIGAAAGGVKFNHIPAKGDADAAIGLMGGQVDAIAVSPGGWTSLVQSGKLRLLATLGEKRMRKFPDTPVVRETGYDVVHLTPLGLAGPRDLPVDLVRKLHDGFRKAVNDPEFLAKMDEMENPILYQGPEEFTRSWARYYQEEGERVRRFLTN
jgi:tripartite-type tricarboxylate transporter receptor subunit TctC